LWMYWRSNFRSLDFLR